MPPEPATTVPRNAVDAKPAAARPTVVPSMMSVATPSAAAATRPASLASRASWNASTASTAAAKGAPMWSVSATMTKSRAWATKGSTSIPYL